MKKEYLVKAVLKTERSFLIHAKNKTEAISIADDVLFDDENEDIYLSEMDCNWTAKISTETDPADISEAVIGKF